MAALDARVSLIEVRVEEHTRVLGDVRELIVALDCKVDGGFAAVDRRFERMDRRFEVMDQRIAMLDQKEDRHFTWLVGIQLTALATFAATLLGMVGMLLRG